MKKYLVVLPILASCSSGLGKYNMTNEEAEISPKEFLSKQSNPNSLQYAIEMDDRNLFTAYL